jgi:altronate dehydratase small subunit
MDTKDALVIRRIDNVATALQDIEQSNIVAARLREEKFTIEARDRIPFGFKIALKSIPKGEPIIKYGEVIGKASTDIQKGALVHIHNLEGTRGRGDLEKRRDQM